jgi:hypothetical protein
LSIGSCASRADSTRCRCIAAFRGLHSPCPVDTRTSTPIVALDAIQRLTEGYGNDPVVTGLVDNNEIWISPIWNPDGYWTWRHNGRPGGTIDLNRNYPFL